MATVAQTQLKDYLEGWSKWQIATAVGAPIALGLAGLWFYKRRNSVKKSDEKSDKNKERTVILTGARAAGRLWLFLLLAWSFSLSLP